MRSPETTTIPRPVQSEDYGVILARLERSVRQGDWGAVSALTEQMAGQRHPENLDALAERLRGLQSALVAARVARTRLVASLTRARAAAGFIHYGTIAARQEYGGPADF